MYLMYIDESGDIGLPPSSPTRYFILSAIIIHELRWKDTLKDLVSFRRDLRDKKGLKLKEEIHCTDFINRPGPLVRIKRNDRLDIIKQSIDWLNSQPDLSVFSVVVDKQGRALGYDVFEAAWNVLLMRFENTLSYKNFPGPRNPDDRGIVLSDNTDGGKLRSLIRKMRHFNMIPSMYGTKARNLQLQYVIEDPVLRDSQYSFMHQMNDVVAYCAKQMYEPNSYMRKKGGHNFYKRLSNVSLKVVSRKNSFGIVEI
ncbi:DUF3800 domain-containing protein [Chitinophaga pinensis]|uniref:DUF3800 domain-containing protein n=1 Tax=Chitinophaga pinensis (strain ATCC 43595 / DSM 2588 / LMG 13176 / NBRC 15968 / NCIMB 11800 / UQM 2034) TaxID=485918 RepID=A0A979G659_CHIPD|nr:DUF3800 domain-containing protein [Chitinophaga pinensis]ACU61337.1 hypothetical protein Cpin_3875 [Chitinophaga pinensis DSM 2588]